MPARRRIQHRAVEPAERTDDDTHVEEFVPKKFGDLITADHIVIGDELAHSSLGDVTALVCFDRSTSALGVYPAPRRTSDETLKGFQAFVGPETDVKLVYPDGAPELRAALQ